MDARFLDLIKKLGISKAGKEPNKMSWWKSRSHLSDSDEAYGEATPGAGVNRSTSPPKKSRGKKAADEDYPGYGDGNRGGGYNGGGYGGGGGGYNNGHGGSTPYRSSGNSVRGTVTPYGGGYNSNPPYGNGGYNSSPYGNSGGGGGGYNNSSYGHGGEGYDAGRTPMYINTREVHVYGAPTNNDGDDQRRGGGGFFGPALHAVGHFVDRRFGLDSRN
jgi:hypothetical protein